MNVLNVALVLGASPQLIKSAPLIHIAKKDSDIDIQRRLKDKNNPFGDGKAAEKIIKTTKEILKNEEQLSKNFQTPSETETYHKKSSQQSKPKPLN